MISPFFNGHVLFVFGLIQTVGLWCHCRHLPPPTSHLTDSNFLVRITTSITLLHITSICKLYCLTARCVVVIIKRC